VNERSNLISKLKSDFKARAAYIQAKVGTLVPSQIRALRLKSEMPRQPDLAHAAHMHQSRISMLETPGANPTISTLSSIAAALKVGLKIEFVSFTEMLDWENGFSQDRFKVTKIDNDLRFLNPGIVQPAPQITDISWITKRVPVPQRWPAPPGKGTGSKVPFDLPSPQEEIPLPPIPLQGSGSPSPQNQIGMGGTQ
jgi:transcriptional regulator with XRE-family HTH domain